MSLILTKETNERIVTKETNERIVSFVTMRNTPLCGAQPFEENTSSS